MSTLSAEQVEANVEWARRGDFSRPKRHGSGEQGRAESRALLEAAGVDLAALEAARAVGRPRLAVDEATVPLTFRTTQSQAEQIRAQAAREGRGFAAIMREALSQYLEAASA